MSYEKLIDSSVFSRSIQEFQSFGYADAPVLHSPQFTDISYNSLCHAADNKRTVMLAALKRHDEKERAKSLSVVSHGRASVATIQALFDCVASTSLDNKGRVDCFQAISALHLAPHDDDAESIVMNSFSEIESFFGSIIRKGQQRGEIRRDIDAGQVAAMLFAALIGLHVIALGVPGKSVLQPIIRQALALVE